MVEKQKNEDKKVTSNSDPSAYDEQEKVAERFMRLEDEIRESSSTVRSDGEVLKGEIRDVKRVPSEEIPNDYPVDIETEEALGFTIKTSQDKSVSVYMNWFDDKTNRKNSLISDLLKMHNIQETQISDLYGKEVLLESENNHLRLKTPDNPRKGKTRYSAILPSLLIGYFALFLGIQTTIIPFSIGLVMFTITIFLVLPFFVYQDSWKLRNMSKWEGGPLFWATVSMLPIINIFTTLMYISQRRNQELISN